MSKFYHYSVNNMVLISMQMPEATLVAGKSAWMQKFGRYLTKDARAIQIFAPRFYKKKEEEVALDPDTGEPVLDRDGNVVKTVQEDENPRFTVVQVYDVSDTEGKELPDFSLEEVRGTAQRYGELMKAFLEISPVPIGYEDIPGTTKGYFHLVEKRIAIQEGMGEFQTLKTLIHEISHATLHDENLKKAGERKDRDTIRVETESITYTICRHFGIGTSNDSFRHLTEWSSGRKLWELKDFLETIRKGAGKLIDSTEKQLMVTKKREMNVDTIGQNDEAFFPRAESSHTQLKKREKERLFCVEDVVGQKKDAGLTGRKTIQKPSICSQLGEKKHVSLQRPVKNRMSGMEIE